MRIVAPPPEIGDKDGFTKSDLFDRAPLGEGLTNLLVQVTDPLVVALDGQWGSGKTTFLKMWAGHMRNLGVPVLYFDAFEKDYSQDAFTALAGEIMALVDSHAKTSTPAAQEYLKKALGAGRVLARAALKVGVKVGTAGALEAADLEKLAEAVSIEAEALTDKYLGEALTKQKEATGAIQGFREALEALPAALSHSTAGAYPLVVMIDELDRCRPQFALELLERIKHFFSVPNVHFILGVNTSQLENSIRAAYGGDMDARTYLQKFVSLTFPLVDQGRFQNERVIPKYIAYLQQQLKFEPQDRDVVNAASDLIQLVATARGLSLRHIERMMTNLALAVAFTKPNSLKPGPIVGGLCALRVVAPPLYAKAKEGMLTFEEVDEALFSAGTVEDASTRREWQRNWWRFALDKSAPEELIESFGRGLWNYDVDRERLVQVVANSIIDHLGP